MIICRGHDKERKRKQWFINWQRYEIINYIILCYLKTNIWRIQKKKKKLKQPIKFSSNNK